MTSASLPMHYATTSDGVRIAYVNVGDGRPLIFGSNIFGDASRYCGGDPHVDSFGKFFPPALLLEEIQRLGEQEIPLVPLGILQLTVGVLYLIPRTSVLGAIVMTGFLGGAEAIQIRVNGSGAFLLTLPLLLGVLAWGGIWLRDE